MSFRCEGDMTRIRLKIISVEKVRRPKIKGVEIKEDTLVVRKGLPRIVGLEHIKYVEYITKPPVQTAKGDRRRAATAYARELREANPKMNQKQAARAAGEKFEVSSQAVYRDLRNQR